MVAPWPEKQKGACREWLQQRQCQLPGCRSCLPGAGGWEEPSQSHHQSSQTRGRGCPVPQWAALGSTGVSDAQGWSRWLLLVLLQFWGQSYQTWLFSFLWLRRVWGLQQKCGAESETTLSKGSWGAFILASWRPKCVRAGGTIVPGETMSWEGIMPTIYVDSTAEEHHYTCADIRHADL